MKKIGNLFVTHRNEEMKQISNEEEQTIRKTETLMESILSEQCLYCGNLYIEIIDSPMVSISSEGSGMWNI